MPSSWIVSRATKADGRNRGRPRYLGRYRLGGRESRARYAGSFGTKSEAVARKRWVDGELAALRVPDLAVLAEPVAAPTVRAVAARWQDSRVDVRDSTAIQHRTALGRLLPVLGDLSVDRITSADVAELVAKLHGDGKARESIRKSVTALAMVLDFAGLVPNPARDRVQVKLPREEATEPEPPTADTVEAVLWRLTPAYALATLVLEATGARVGELDAATLGDLDETRQAWLVRSSVAKTRRPRWVVLTDDLFEALAERLPAREDRVPDDAAVPGRDGRPVTHGDRPRLPGRRGAALRAARAPAPQDLAPAFCRRLVGRHRRPGRPALEGRHRRPVLARTRRLPRDRPGEMLEHVRAVRAPVRAPETKNPSPAGVFEGTAHQAAGSTQWDAFGDPCGMRGR